MELALNLKNKSALTTERQPEKSLLLASFTNGVIPDAQLFEQEIRVQKAWAEELAKIAMISPSELEQILNSLESAAELMRAKKFEWKIADEDIHMNLESYVNAKTDNLGKKMHAGRSRNDLIATTLRIHVAETAQEIINLLHELISSLTTLAKNNLEIIIPGMTHLQNGQPIRWSHALLGHAWAIKRDCDRFIQVRKNALKVMPLGSAALAGTTIKVNLETLARKLGFEKVPTNSYDLVGDRDSLVEMLQAVSLFGIHLSRLAEDIIYWSSTPIGLVKLSPNWSTGSSIMPNKRNPDVAELTRGKASLWIGDLNGVMTLIKGLATCYGSDLHESKAPYLRATTEIKLTIKVFSNFVAELIPDHQRAQSLLNHGHILATEIADNLTQKGMSFRDAYNLVATLVEKAESKQLQVHELKNSDLHVLTKLIDEKFLQNITFEAAVEKRSFAGGTAKAQILQQINFLNEGISFN